jgi:hypothetical protein
MTNSPITYQGFEDPEHTYYGAGTSQNVPTFYTGAYQVRQFGVGGASATGAPVTLTAALANPPAAMATAEALALKAVVTTANDVVRYYPNTDPDLPIS